jgi:PAS domain S-box-containing protein
VLSAAVDITEWRRAEERAGQELETSRRLLEAARALNETLELDDVLRTLTGVLLEIIGHTRADVYLWDADRRVATLAASAGRESPPQGMTLSFEEFSRSAREVIESCCTMVVDYDALPPAERGAASRLHSHTSLQVPMVRHDRLVGLVILDDPGERREFSERERELAEGIAAEAAVAIEDARLLDEYRRAESRLAAVFEFAPTGIVIGDLDGRIVESNRSFDRMLGYDEGETYGQPISDFTFAEEMLRDNRLLADMTAGRREGYWLPEKRFVRKDGSVIWVTVSASLVRDARGEPQFTIAVVEDITTQRNTREALEEKDAAIRDAYVDVISAVTGGKLLLMTPDELTAALGDPVSAPHPVGGPEEIRDGRHRLDEVLRELGRPARDEEGLLLATTEALTNAWKHGAAAKFSVRTTDGTVQVVVVDEGPGLDFKTLPKATLTAGFSTAVSLGMGFTIMLDVCDRVLLATEDGFTAVVLEMDTTQAAESAADEAAEVMPWPPEAAAGPAADEAGAAEM